MHNFTPIASLAGGIVIGVAAAAMLLLEGKIAGISGIFEGVLRPNEEASWKTWFFAGLIAGGMMLRIAMPQAFAFGVLRSWSVLALAGLLVGFGTRLGNGCTSGHGVCGISRLSGRSIVATVTFMASGALVVAVANHVLRLTP